jgi:hypothetical protein
MTTLTRERLEQLANFRGAPVTRQEEQELAKFKLAAMQQEPLMWVNEDSLPANYPYDKLFPFSKVDIVRMFPVYAPPVAVSVPDEQHSERFNWTLGQWAEHLGGHYQGNNPENYYEFGSFMAVAAMLSQFGTVQQKLGWNACRAAMLQAGNSPVIPEEKGSSLQLRNLIRKRHAEWSETTFGNVGPIGPLKHLSKEALEAADDVGDLSEWADMQFLLWDAQRRAGISDGEITAAMEEKLKVNMARQWPEPKDGEPRLHIKTEQQQEKQ